jgi:hypothetical protein
MSLHPVSRNTTTHALSAGKLCGDIWQTWPAQSRAPPGLASTKNRRSKPDLSCVLCLVWPSVVSSFPRPWSCFCQYVVVLVPLRPPPIDTVICSGSCRNCGLTYGAKKQNRRYSTRTGILHLIKSPCASFSESLAISLHQIPHICPNCQGKKNRTLRYWGPKSCRSAASLSHSGFSGSYRTYHAGYLKFVSAVCESSTDLGQTYCVRCACSVLG